MGYWGVTYNVENEIENYICRLSNGINIKGDDFISENLKFRAIIVMSSHKRVRDIMTNVSRMCFNKPYIKCHYFLRCSGEIKIDFLDGSQILVLGNPNPDSLRGYRCSELVFDDDVEITYELKLRASIMTGIHNYSPCIFLSKENDKCLDKRNIENYIEDSVLEYDTSVIDEFLYSFNSI